MPIIRVSHFEFCVLFSLLASIVLGITGKNADRDRVRYAIRCFLYFMVAVFGLGWLMFLGHG